MKIIHFKIKVIFVLVLTVFGGLAACACACKGGGGAGGIAALCGCLCVLICEYLEASKSVEFLQIEKNIQIAFPYSGIGLGMAVNIAILVMGWPYAFGEFQPIENLG